MNWSGITIVLLMRATCSFLANPDTTVSKKKLQTVGNACAKFLTGGKTFDSATEKLKELHWLPLKNRSKYQLLILAHKMIHPADACTCNVLAYLRRNLKIYSNENVRFTRSQLGPTFVPLTLN